MNTMQMITEVTVFTSLGCPGNTGRNGEGVHQGAVGGKGCGLTAGGRGSGQGRGGGRGRGQGGSGRRGRRQGRGGGRGRGQGRGGGRGCGQGRGGGRGRGQGRGGGRGHGRGRGRGGGQATTSGRGSGRSAGKSRGGKRAEPSSLPWQPVDPGKDTIPSPLSFCGDVGSTLQMPPGSQPVDYYRQLIDDRVIHLIVEETNK